MEFNNIEEVVEKHRRSSSSLKIRYKKRHPSLMKRLNRALGSYLNERTLMTVCVAVLILVAILSGVVQLIGIKLE